MDGDTAARVRALRARLDHPVIDADGHLIEAQPLFHRYLERIGGKSFGERYQRELSEHPTGSRGNRERGDMRGAWWGTPNDAYDLATVMAPRLLHQRLEELASTSRSSIRLSGSPCRRFATPRFGERRCARSTR